MFNGSVVLRSDSRVGGDVVSRQAPQIENGATVEGSVYDLPTRWDYWDITFVGRLAWWLAYTVSTLVLGLVLLMLARGLDPASVRALRERLGGTIGFGLLWFVVLPIVAVLLSVTVLGTPWGCSCSSRSGSCTRSATWSVPSPSAGWSSRSPGPDTWRSWPDGGHCA